MTIWVQIIQCFLPQTSEEIFYFYVLDFVVIKNLEPDPDSANNFVFGFYSNVAHPDPNM